jgi:LacI family transcriptional regulator
MREVAKLAGVSHMTVSLALRNHPSVAEETRDRVLKIADEHGYRPDPMVSRVMAGLRFGKEAGHVLAYVTQFGRMDWKNHHVHGATFRGAKEAAEKFGYRMEIFEMGPYGVSGRRLRQILYTRSIQGLIINSDPERVGHLGFDLSRFSMVQLGTGIVRPVLHRVTTNAVHNLNTALRRLRRLGAQRVGMVLDAKVDVRNEHAWTSTFATYAKSIPASLRVPPLMPERMDFSVFRKWFEKHRPDAIVCIESRMLQWLADLGVEYPSEVQVAALDLSEKDAGFAGMRQNHEAVGRIALEMLLGQIHVNDLGVPEVPRTTMIDGHWVDGSSCVRKKQPEAKSTKRRPRAKK